MLNKKILSVLLTVAMILSMCVSAAAEEVGQDEVVSTFTTNEYDIMEDLKQLSVDSLKKSGYSEEAIDEIKSFSFEKALLERAQLSEKELYSLGYNADEIAILKSYNGDSLEKNPQAKGLLAQLSGNISRVSYSTNKMSAKFSWEWDKAPVMSGAAIKDIVTCGFAATNDASMSCVVRIDTTSCVIDYYDGISKVGTKYPSVTIKNPQGHVEVKFNMREYFSLESWAKKGTLTIGVKEETTVNRLASVAFAFGYGHTKVVINPAISVTFGGSFGVGLTFGPATFQEFYKTMILRSNGSYNTYNGT